MQNHQHYLQCHPQRQRPAVLHAEMKRSRKADAVCCTPGACCTCRSSARARGPDLWPEPTAAAVTSRGPLPLVPDRGPLPLVPDRGPLPLVPAVSVALFRPSICELSRGGVGGRVCAAGHDWPHCCQSGMGSHDTRTTLMYCLGHGSRPQSGMGSHDARTNLMYCLGHGSRPQSRMGSHDACSADVLPSQATAAGLGILCAIFEVSDWRDPDCLCLPTMISWGVCLMTEPSELIRPATGIPSGRWMYGPEQERGGI